MQEARYELDYKTQGGALSVQIAVLPEGDVAMTIAEASPERVENQVNLLKKYLEDFQRILEQKVVEENAKPKKTASETVKEFIAVTEAVWVRMASMDVAIKLAEIVNGDFIKTSALYSYKDEYYLRLKIAPSDQIGELFLSLCEYGEELFLEHEGAAMIYEHGRCLIKQDAVSTLKSL